MTELLRALSLSFAQLSDRRILAVLAKSLGWTLAIFAGLGIALYYALDGLFTRWGAGQASEWTGLVTLLIVIIGSWFLFRIVALAVIQFFADDVVRAVEERHYPEAAEQMRSLPFAREMRNSTRATVRALALNALALPVALLLLFTAIGPAIVFALVNAVLLGRELRDIVWQRHPAAHATNAAKIAPIGFLTRFLLGGAIVALLAIPFLNLLAPVIGAASATHLVHRGVSRR
ncbi:hypothetical protein GRI38_12700 [Altererythrobacter aurantiacus]|uniref:CysZ protein n=1 Tax=Parapontixanthobacter aurantiacus TaxID=1463599 RepID=A0A844ZIZ8_9SPHN|nr:EI24 domain-containing protein [Parapontixanthobacter aurantiacus]MXO86887.1 hypothetical protein [Parapontixanthobacter aurantiacus]